LVGLSPSLVCHPRWFVTLVDLSPSLVCHSRRESAKKRKAFEVNPCVTSKIIWHYPSPKKTKPAKPGTISQIPCGNDKPDGNDKPTGMTSLMGMTNLRE
ncbi:MAG: hypothetical protein SGI94_15465, partial [Saprospiraceae bacterium]|nr:hypothetical protein [Saprospiraceae bacterium]